MTTKSKTPLSSTDKLMILGLITAAIGVAIQIFSGAPYPRVPPVFFILLTPAAMLIFGRWYWISIVIAITGLFLLLGLFTSGAYIRLFSMTNLGDFAGIWIQTIGHLIAIVASIISIVQHYFYRQSINRTSI